MDIEKEKNYMSFSTFLRNAQLHLSNKADDKLFSS